MPFNFFVIGQKNGENRCKHWKINACGQFKEASQLHRAGRRVTFDYGKKIPGIATQPKTIPGISILMKIYLKTYSSFVNIRLSRSSGVTFLYLKYAYSARMKPMAYQPSTNIHSIGISGLGSNGR